MIDLFINDILSNSELFEIKDSYDDFEEIPLISRFSQMNKIKNVIPKTEWSDFLMEIALCFLQLKIMSLQEKKMRMGIDIILAVTVCDWWESLEEDGFAIPSLFISRKPNLFNFAGTVSDHWYEEIPNFSSVFRKKEFFSRYNGIYSISQGTDWRIDRVYLIPKNNLELLVESR
jgi:hypothetical protein